MRIIHSSKAYLILFLGLINAEDDNDFNWQKLGNCGVPANRPNSNIFEIIKEDLSVTQNDRNDDFDTLKGQEVRTIKDLLPKREEQTQDGRIVGGQVAKPHSWPWQAHLAVCGRWYGHLECNICGGSIIHPKFIISAAHCVPSGASGTIVLGAHSISRGGKQRIPVQQFHIHPDWNVPTLFDHDISILELKHPADITVEVIPICLPHHSTCFGVDTPCVVTGWGLTDEKGGFPDDLHEVAVRLMGQKHCKSFEGYEETITDNMLCAGFTSGEQDACAGDSGGPLVCSLAGGGWVLYGVVSWGYGCARVQSPGVYTRVNRMLQFIFDVTGVNADDDLAMQGDLCRRYEDNFEETWKYNNDHIFPSKKPDWHVPTEAPEVEPYAVDTKYCSYSETSGGYNRISIREMPNGGEIVSQGYGYVKRYPDNQNCEYHIVNDNPSKYIKLTINNVRLDCYDKFLITPQEEKPISICKQKKAFEIKHPTEFKIQFITNYSKSSNGFQLKYEFASIYFMCKGNDKLELSRHDDRKAKTVRIQSENYPKAYSSSSQCRWIVRAAPGDTIGIYLKKFATENRECSAKNDNLMIFKAEDCENETLSVAPMWATICGYRKKGKYNTGLTSACFAFIADGDNFRNRGFDIYLYGIKGNY